MLNSALLVGIAEVHFMYRLIIQTLLEKKVDCEEEVPRYRLEFFARTTYLVGGDCMQSNMYIDNFL